jgi:hypothetical protein
LHRGLGALSQFFAAEDPALIGRCHRRLVAPLSGPIKDQDDLRVVAPMRRLSGPEAVTQVPFALMEMRFPRGVPGPRSGAVSARPIRVGASKIALRLVELVFGGTDATMATMVVVVVVVLVTVAKVLATLASIVIVLQHATHFRSHFRSDHSSEGTSDRTSDDASDGTKDSIIT